MWGGGSILWGSEGYINCIEMYGFGDYFREDIREFELSTDLYGA